MAIKEASSARARHLRDPLLLLALGLGSGLTPRGPGTAGTLVGVVLFLLLAGLPASLQALAVAAAVLLGIPLCGYAARRLGVHDDPGIVWDEIAGYLVTMIALPAEPAWVLAGFVVFRLLDIAKPWPIRWLDRHLGGGSGIMADDLVAGALGCAGLHLVAWLL